MGVSIETLPIEYAPNTYPCNLFASHSPTEITLRRKDYEGVFVTDNGSGFCRLTFAPIPYPAGFVESVSVGEKIFFQDSYYSGIATVTFVNAPGELDVDIPYQADGTCFVNMFDQRKNFRAIVTARKFEILSGDYLSNGFSIQCYPDQSGKIYFEASTLLRNLVSCDDSFFYDQLNYADKEKSGWVELKIYSDWDGLSESILDNQATLTTIYAAMQPGNKGGSNMVRFFTVDTDSGSTKYLTNFKRPKYFIGFPFDLSFYYSLGLLLSGGLQKTETIILQDGSTGATTDFPLLFSERFYLNRLMMSGGYGTAAKSVKVQMNHFSLTSVAQENTLEEIFVDLEHCIPRNPIYLRWINTLGGWDYWCFGGTQEREIEWKAGEVFSKYFGAIESQTSTGKFVGKSAVPSLKIGSEQLTTEQIEGIENLIYSPEVQMYYLLPDNLPGWKTVRVNRSDYKRKTRNKRHSIELTIQLLDINIQTQ